MTKLHTCDTFSGEKIRQMTSDVQVEIYGKTQFSTWFKFLLLSPALILLIFSCQSWFIRSCGHVWSDHLRRTILKCMEGRQMVFVWMSRLTSKIGSTGIMSLLPRSNLFFYSLITHHYTFNI